MNSSTFRAYRQDWFGNVRGDLLSGLVVALALIPEAIAFSIAVITAIVGGRPGMISAATAATAVLMITLVRDHGLEYLLAATVLAGLIQIGAGLLKLGRFMRYVSRSVMTGFVNALAILIFMAQLPELDLGAPGVTWLTYVLVAAGLAIIYLLPRLTTVIPSPLVTIVVLTLLVTLIGWDVRTVGDMGALPDTLPVFLIPQVPLTLETLLVILPYSIAVAVVGLLESLMPVVLLPGMRSRSQGAGRLDRDAADPSRLRLVAPLRMQFFGGRTHITGGREPAARPDPVLIRALRAAHALLERDASGAPAVAAAPPSTYNRRLLRLAFLAPDLQRSILAGRQRPDLTLAALMDAPVPPLWSEQMRRFGSSPTN